MKILLVSPFTSASGSAIRFWNIALMFREQGHSVVYTDRAGPRSGQLYQAPGIAYFPSPPAGPFFLDIAYSAVFNILLLFRNLDCDLFYALKPAPNNCFAAIIARLLGKKIFLDIDDLDYEYLDNGFKKATARFFFRAFPRFFRLVTFHTPNLGAYCRERLHIADSRLFFLTQGVSQEFLRINIADKRAGVPKSIIYAATLGITSDFEDLLPMLARVCGRFPETKITVVGDGVRRTAFEAEAARLGLAGAIRFAGRVPHNELPELMAEHSIGLNYMRPSFVNNCRAILKMREYLACGLQVVCNRCGDAESFGNYAFVEPDIEHMENRLIALLSKPVEINLAGRVFIEQNYSWKTIMSGFAAHCENSGLLPHTGDLS